MRRPECQSWIDISDRVAIGEFISDEERRFLRAHEGSCRGCAEEAAVWGGLDGSTLSPVLDGQALEQILLEAQKLRIDETPVVPRRRWALSRGKVAAGLATGLAIAAAVSLVMRRGDRPAVSAAVEHGNAVPTTLAEPAPISEPAPLVATPEPRIAAGASPACRTVAPGVTACLGAGTEVTTARLAPPRRLLDLVRGRVVVSLTPQPAGTSFGVATPAGTVTAVGTVFSVEITTTGDTLARVERGEVVVKAAVSGAEQHLYAGEQLRIGDASAAAPLAPQDRKRDLSLLAYREDRAPRSDKSGELPERDDRSTLRGEKVAEGPRAAAEPKPVAAPSPPAVAQTAAPGSPPPRAAGETTASGRQPSARQLLGRARALRSQGSFREAAEVYRAAHAANPQSAEGLAALVSLGGLLLSELNEPAGALQAFETYLNGGKGDLAQEAEFGRIRALRALGRHDAEKAAIQSFLASHPDGPEAQVLRRRLETMNKK